MTAPPTRITLRADLAHHASTSTAPSFNRATFTQVAIRSGAGDDTIQIADALTEATTIETGAGADTVIGGPGRRD